MHFFCTDTLQSMPKDLATTSSLDQICLSEVDLLLSKVCNLISTLLVYSATHSKCKPKMIHRSTNPNWNTNCIPWQSKAQQIILSSSWNCSSWDQACVQLISFFLLPVKWIWVRHGFTLLALPEKALQHRVVWCIIVVQRLTQTHSRQLWLSSLVSLATMTGR